LWLAALFASVELCHRSYQNEAANGALEGLLLSPVDKGAVYLGKAAAAFVQLIALMVVTSGVVIVLFGLPVGPEPALLLLTAVLGVAGLSTLGSLLGLLAVRGRTRQAALPVLVLPLVSPVIISSARATADLTQGTTTGIGGWLSLLVAFDAAYLAAGYLVFGHLLED
jgi:heme exporter protein B